MLTSSFLHMDGVGRQLEKTLWAAGVTSWRRARALCAGRLGRVPGLGPAKLRALARGVAVSERRLADGDAAFFNERLPASERWRMAASFRRRLVFLDIETDGLDPSAAVTVVGVYARGRPRLFVRGVNLREFPRFASPRDVWVTFNGLAFDGPRLVAEFGRRIRPAAHIDLHWCLRGVGLHGGLKRLERLFGLRRPARLAGLGGEDAVRLWRKYARDGDVSSLRTLLEYAMADVVGLEPLLAETVRRCARRRRLPVDDLPPAPSPAGRGALVRRAVEDIVARLRP